MDTGAPSLPSLIRLDHPLLTEREVLVLNALIRKRLDYMNQGRGREAHAVAMCLVIVWQGLIRPDIVLPDTQHGAIDPLAGFDGEQR